MINYFYTKEYDRLYVHDNETGFFMRFDEVNKKWVIPEFSFMQIDHDYDDFTVIHEDIGKEISQGISFDEEYKEFLFLRGKL